MRKDWLLILIEISSVDREKESQEQSSWAKTGAKKNRWAERINKTKMYKT